LKRIKSTEKARGMERDAQEDKRCREYALTHNKIARKEKSTREERVGKERDAAAMV
jgi:hypothetical protein